MSAEGAPAGASEYGLLSRPAYRGEFAVRYAEFRPRPPEDLFALLLSLAPARPPELVVDLGAGTGISTAPWSGRARHVVGIELNPAMLQAAIREVFLHTRQLAPAAHVAQLPLVFGPVARRRAEGATERDLGLDRLAEAARRRLKPDANVLWWSYRVRVAVTETT